MKLSELAQNLLTNQPFSYPEYISLPSEGKSGLFRSKNIFWDKIQMLRRFTDVSADKFSELHEGSTGWEYNMIMVYVEGKFFYSEPQTSKEYTTVTSKHELDFKMEFDPKALSLKDIVLINHKQAGVITYTGEKEILARQEKIKSGNYTVGTACHIHSHPQIQVQGTRHRIYTFFSRVDITSFLGTSIPLLGLVTDRFWLLAKTKSSIGVPTQGELHHLTLLEARKEKKFIESCGDLMSRYEYVLYTGEFGSSKLTRVG
jgi:hypothetical protein